MAQCLILETRAEEDGYLELVIADKLLSAYNQGYLNERINEKSRSPASSFLARGQLSPAG